MEKHVGTVFNFDRKRCFGFIDADGRPKEDDKLRIFFHFGEVLPDVVGRRVLNPGTRVSFQLKLMWDGRERAMQVESLETPVDPNAYFEDSSVQSWDATKRSGYLERPDGSTIYFHGDDIMTLGEDLLLAGRWVSHRIERSQANGRGLWKAVDIRIYDTPEPEPTFEEFFLSLPELPSDLQEPAAVSTPIAAVGEQPSVLSPRTRKLSLREIYLQRKLAS